MQDEPASDGLNGSDMTTTLKLVAKALKYRAHDMDRSKHPECLAPARSYTVGTGSESRTRRRKLPKILTEVWEMDG